LIECKRQKDKYALTQKQSMAARPTSLTSQPYTAFLATTPALWIGINFTIYSIRNKESNINTLFDILNILHNLVLFL
jgi:hypothetical protein